MRKKVDYPTKIIIAGEARTFIEDIANRHGLSTAEVIAHAIALQKTVYEEQGRGAACRVYRRDGTVLDLIPC
jgi:hypothetical protein